MQEGPKALVLALPRGGVPVAYEVARALTAPLDVLVVPKLGVPGNEELAMGATMRAAIMALREQGPAKIGVLVPVATAETCAEIGAEVDEIVCAERPPFLLGVGEWYRDFSEWERGELPETYPSTV